MKKLLTLAALVATATMSYGQGQIAFGGNTATRVSVDTVVNGAVTGSAAMPAATSGNLYYFALFEAPTTQTTIGASLAGWTFLGAVGTNSQAGRFVGGDSTGNVTIPSATPGDHANFAFIGWSSNLGNSEAAALAAWNAGDVAHGNSAANFWFGISGVAVNEQIGGGTTAIGSPEADISGWKLNYQVVPEPSTFALAGLGAAAMLIFRRRK